MKKLFVFEVANKAPERQVEAIKHEIKKYVARERRKDLPEGYDFWDFTCQIGETAEFAQDIHIKEINSKIDGVFHSGKNEFFFYLKSKPRKRNSKK